MDVRQNILKVRVCGGTFRLGSPWRFHERQYNACGSYPAQREVPRVSFAATWPRLMHPVAHRQVQQARILAKLFIALDMLLRSSTLFRYTCPFRTESGPKA